MTYKKVQGVLKCLPDQLIMVSVRSADWIKCLPDQLIMVSARSADQIKCLPGQLLLPLKSDQKMNIGRHLLLAFIQRNIATFCIIHILAPALDHAGAGLKEHVGEY